MVIREQSKNLLAEFSDIIIPANARYNVPSAGDEAICAAIIKSIGSQCIELDESLHAINKLARRCYKMEFTDLSKGHQHTVVDLYSKISTDRFNFLMMLVLQFYYQDTRVLISLNIEPLAPYPKGFALEEGDWSLLDSVKNDWYLKAPSK